MSRSGSGTSLATESSIARTVASCSLIACTVERRALSDLAVTDAGDAGGASAGGGTGGGTGTGGGSVLPPLLPLPSSSSSPNRSAALNSGMQRAQGWTERRRYSRLSLGHGVPRNDVEDLELYRPATLYPSASH